MSLTIKKQPRRPNQAQGPAQPGAVQTAGGPLTVGTPTPPPVRAQPQGASGVQGTGVPLAQPGPVVDPTQDPDYIARHALLGRTFRDTNTALDQDTAKIENLYGFGTDVSNPFSRQALLRQAFANQQRATVNSAAARGQLYAGSKINQQAIDTRNNDTATDTARRQYTDALDTVSRARTAAQTTFDSGDLDALAPARDRAINSPPPADTLPPQVAGAPQTPAQKRRAARLKEGISLKGGTSAAKAKDLRRRGLL